MTLFDLELEYVPSGAPWVVPTWSKSSLSLLGTGTDLWGFPVPVHNPSHTSNDHSSSPSLFPAHSQGRFEITSGFLVVLLRQDWP